MLLLILVASTKHSQVDFRGESMQTHEIWQKFYLTGFQGPKFDTPKAWQSRLFSLHGKTAYASMSVIWVNIHWYWTECMYQMSKASETNYNRRVQGDINFDPSSHPDFIKNYLLWEHMFDLFLPFSHSPSAECLGHLLPRRQWGHKISVGTVRAATEKKVTPLF